jgi:superfamily II DNA or RNA helicase
MENMLTLNSCVLSAKPKEGSTTTSPLQNNRWGNPQLFTWQQEHAARLLEALRIRGIAVDASDTGTGKTFIAAQVAKNYGHPVFIVCPKVVIPKWKQVAAVFGVSPIAVMNVERLKRSAFIAQQGKSWTWLLPAGTLVIADEAHQYGGINTANASILYNTRTARLPVLALSATLANSPLRLRALGYLLGLFPNWYAFWSWSLQHGAHEETIVRWTPAGRKSIKTIQFNPHSAHAQEGVKKIHSSIFQANLGQRLRSGESPGFPENHTVVECLQFDGSSEIRKQYDIMSKEVNLKAALAVTKTLELRQKIEQLRLPDLAQMIRELVENRSVVVFVNFRESIAQLQKLTEDLQPSVIQGEQTEEHREAERLRFQDNQTRLCLCTFGAGGVGLDLHDLHGRPRVSIINPVWSAVQLTQALGRIHRAGALSPAVQKLIYAAGTIEEDVAARVEAGLGNLSLLQDGDVMPIQYINKEL